MKKVLFILTASLILFSCKNKKDSIANCLPEENSSIKSEQTASIETIETEKTEIKEDDYSGPEYSEDIYFEKDAVDPDDDDPVKIRWVYVNDMPTGNPDIFAYKTNIRIPIKPYIKLKTFGIKREGPIVCYFVLLPRYMWEEAQSRYGYINADCASTEPNCFFWNYLKNFRLAEYLVDKEYRSVEKYGPASIYIFEGNGSFKCLVEERGVGAFGRWKVDSEDNSIVKTFASVQFDGDDSGQEMEEVEVDYKAIDMHPSIVKLQSDGEELIIYHKFNFDLYKSNPENYNDCDEPYIYYYDFNDVFNYYCGAYKGDPFDRNEDIRIEFIESGIYLDNEYYLEKYNKYWDGIINEIFHKDDSNEDEISTSNNETTNVELDDEEDFFD
ncbi:MAG: hypothetical protein KBT21_03785 [Treponema sp.]|nr:hypothetical protein [Candidatus Treponema merdequi]